MEPAAIEPAPASAGPGRPYGLHFFVCTSGTDCPLDGPALAMRSAMKAEVKRRGLTDRVRVNQSGCLNQCGHGPVMVVYPEAAWYAHLDVSSALEVLDAHLEGAPERAARYRYRLGPGAHKAPRGEDGARHCDRSCLDPTHAASQ